MDPISHGVVAAHTAGRLGKRAGLSVRHAMLVGALAGMSPDLDVLIRAADYPLLAIKYHRFITHAWAVAPLGGVLIAVLAMGLLRLLRAPAVGFRPLWLLGTVALMSHGFLDALTNYGTHLFWPFTMRRESWSIISIVDPIFTGVLIVLAVLACTRQSQRILTVALIWMLSYWSVGLWQRERATEVMVELAASRGHTIVRSEVKPSFGNIVVWRLQYEHAGTVYVDAVHLSPWAGRVLYAGNTLKALRVDDARFATISPIQQQDLKDFAFFSDGWLAEVPNAPDLIADARFSMLPQGIGALWALQLKPLEPEKHAGFTNLRRRQPNDIAALWRMVQGKPLE